MYQGTRKQNPGARFGLPSRRGDGVVRRM